MNLWVVNERWLFSLLWCAGASSVTTNSCHLLKDMAWPDWVMVSSAYSCTYSSSGCNVIPVKFLRCVIKSHQLKVKCGSKFVQVFSKICDTP